MNEPTPHSSRPPRPHSKLRRCASAFGPPILAPGSESVRERAVSVGDCNIDVCCATYMESCVRFAGCRGRRVAPSGEACGSSRRGELRIPRRKEVERRFECTSKAPDGRSLGSPDVITVQVASLCAQTRGSWLGWLGDMGQGSARARAGRAGRHRSSNGPWTARR
jgi:hypothetical protein